MVDYLAQHGTKSTPQRKRMRKDQIENSAGGYVWALDPFARLRRFLILGSEGGSYYASERNLTTENVDCIRDCIDTDGLKTVALIVEISKGGNAPKNDPALFALASCISHGNDMTKRAAAQALPEVARFGTQLYNFLTYAETMRGWGRVLKTAVANWYDSKPTEKLAYDAIKYRQRDGWSHRDVLRKSHPSSADNAPIYDWITHGLNPDAALPAFIQGYELAQTSPDAKRTAQLINSYNLPREALKTEHLNDAEVWRAMLDTKMPLTAMIRNLATMTRNNVFDSVEYRKIVIDALNKDNIKKARVHPLNILMALKTYAEGRGYRGTNTWTPNSKIIDALDDAFYLAFDNIEPTGKNVLIGLDVSGSMHGIYGSDVGVGGTPLTPAEAAAAMIMVTLHAENEVDIMGFGTTFQALNFSRKQRLDDIVKATRHMHFGGTDCALPFLWAMKQNNPSYESFIVLTDNETWAGSMHPKQALDKYRQTTGIQARSAVVGMLSNGFTIADPNDPGMIDFVGMDTSAPALMNEFFAGRL